jgi:TolB-like protein/Tfp pilus assembly protein PilF
MSEQQTERRLAAILFADVVGYSSLIQRDEEGTRAVFRKLEKNFFTPLVNLYGGRIIKTMGDAFLIEFSSAIRAVNCAVELQKQLDVHVEDERNLEIRGIKFRIGVNIGDIIVEGDDIHGDGVNVAARLQTSAEPGGVCISGVVHDQVHGKIDVQFYDGGEVELKNLSQSQKVFLWSPESSNRSKDNPANSVDREQAYQTASRHAAIAVLPFDNMSGDAEQEYFSDGISEDIITELSRFRDLHVKARNSSFSYKGEKISVQTVGKELGVSYIVEGSVRKVGNRVRVTAQMVDVENWVHVWAERYDRELEDIFEVQDEITRSIVSVLPNRLRRSLVDRVRRKSTESFSAYEYFLQGRWIYLNTSGTDPRAVTYLNKAIEFDPRYAESYAVLANLYAYARFSLGIWYDNPEDRARGYIVDAIKYGKDDPTVHTLVGEAYYWLGEWDKAKFHIETARRLNPHDVQAMIVHGAILSGSGQSAAGLSCMEDAFTMDPHLPDFAWESKAECLYMLHRYEDAVRLMESWGDPPPHTYAQMAACYAHLGRMNEARLAAEKFKSVCAEDENFARYAANHASICKLKEDKENWLSGYRKAGLLT